MSRLPFLAAIIKLCSTAGGRFGLPSGPMGGAAAEPVRTA